MNLEELTITKAHKGLKEKDFSSVELTRAYLAEIIKKNHLNAFITVTEEEALHMAQEADEYIESHDDFNALTGIPFSVKDAILTQGVRATGAAKILDNYVAPYDATVIARIKENHGVILGKTNCDAFGHGASNENSDYGPVKNPYDESRVSGGSSGGSAVSVAANMSLYSIAEDTGGSIRQPASFCNIVGLKVSYGRNSRYGIMPMASSLDTVGSMAKTVEDVALIMEVIAGHDQKDFTTVSKKVPLYGNLINKSIKGLKIGLPKEYFPQDLDSEIRQSVMAAIDVLKKQGAVVSEVSLPHTEYAIAVYYILVPSEDSSNMARIDSIRYGVRTAGAKGLYDLYRYSREQGFPDEVKRRIMIGTYALSSGYYEAYYKKAQQVRTIIKKEFDSIFKDVDVLITPTSPFAAFKIGEKMDDPLQMYLADIFLSGVSVAGVPGLSVPCGMTQEGLPIGMQIIGPRFQEERILNVGHMYQTNEDRA